MKKLLLAIAISVAAFAPFAARAADEKANARILPTIWYSDLSFSDGNSLDIFGAIQNNSGLAFSGTAHFFVDDKEIAAIPFQSESGVLRMVEAPWKASSGNHAVVIKIDAALPAGKALVSGATDPSSLFVPKVVPPPVPLTAADIQAGAVNAASAISSGVDAAAQALADKLDSLKSGAAAGGETAKDPRVLGTSTGPDDKPSTLTASVVDAGINAGAFLLRHWVWTLSALFAAWIIWKLKKNSGV